MWKVLGLGLGRVWNLDWRNLLYHVIKCEPTWQGVGGATLRRSSGRAADRDTKRKTFKSISANGLRTRLKAWGIFSEIMNMGIFLRPVWRRWYHSPYSKQSPIGEAIIDFLTLCFWIMPAESNKQKTQFSRLIFPFSSRKRLHPRSRR